MNVKMPFGYLSENVHIETDIFKIIPICFENNERIKSIADNDGWIYASQPTNISGKRRVFGLPHNYLLEGEFQSVEEARFVIWCFSFFCGIRLSAEEMGFFDATNIIPHRSFYFYILDKNDYEICLSKALHVLRENTHKDNRLNVKICSVINLLFLSLIPNYMPFEKFNYLYMAIDCCYNILFYHLNKIERGSVRHGDRIESMNELLMTLLPVALQKNHVGEVEAVLKRNSLMHEGIFFDQPLGFSSGDFNTRFINNFVCKIVFYILDCVPDDCADLVSESLCTTLLHFKNLHKSIHG